MGSILSYLGLNKKNVLRRKWKTVYVNVELVYVNSIDAQKIVISINFN